MDLLIATACVVAVREAWLVDPDAEAVEVVDLAARAAVVTALFAVDQRSG